MISFMLGMLAMFFCIFSTITFWLWLERTGTKSYKDLFYYIKQKIYDKRRAFKGSKANR